MTVTKRLTRKTKKLVKAACLVCGVVVVFLFVRRHQFDLLGAKAVRPHDTNTSGPEVKVILLTYRRSGSTYTGDLFNNHPRVFYFYEPLWATDTSFKRRHEPALFLHRDPVYYKENNNHPLDFLKNNVLSSILNCDFEHMYTRPLWAPFYGKSQSFQSFRKCRNHNRDLQGLQSCLPVLRRACTSAKVSVMKVLRISMATAATFLKVDPKVKVIHLVRDPRAVLRSRLSTGLVSRSPAVAGEFCANVSKDLTDSIELKTRYPGRVLTARYEDLAQRPLAFSAQLLTFAGLDMTPRLQQLILNMTSSNDSRVKEGRYGTRRANSGQTAASWRTNVRFYFVSSVDKKCGDLYRLAGYLPFDSEKELRDLSKPFYRDYREASAQFWNT